MNFSRASGILLHPTSLPGPFGIGDLGPGAYAFVDFLEAAGQSLWQVLPLGPTTNAAVVKGQATLTLPGRSAVAYKLR